MPLPAHSPNLEHLKNQAKDLFKAVHANDPHALQRVNAHLPRFVKASSAAAGPQRFLLANALLVIAREYGFPSWPRLKAHVEALAQRGEITAVSKDAPTSAEGRPASREHAVCDLAMQIIDWAMRRDTEHLAARFASMPLRDILAVRAAVSESGAYAALVDTLIAGLRHEDSRIRYNCAGALDHLADERCLESLQQLVNDPLPRVRRMALHALSCEACKLVPLRTDDDIVALLIDRALTDPSINVRRHATAGLSSCCHDARAIHALEGLMERETDPAILRNARWALQRQRSLAPRQATSWPEHNWHSA